MLVVPAEANRSTRDAQRRATGGNIDPFRSRRTSLDARRISARDVFLLVRQPVPHVEHRFLMHRLVLEDRERRLRVIEQRVPWTIELLARERIGDLPIRFVDERLHHRSARPQTARLVRRVRLVRIDAAREQLLELRIDARTAERALHERVEAERRQMAVIEDDRLPQMNRPAVIGLLGEEVEQRTRPLAVAQVRINEGASNHQFAWST